MHGIGQTESRIQDLIDMLECTDPAHEGCRERGSHFFEGLPPSLRMRIQERLDTKKRALRTEAEWERRKAAGMTAGGDQFRAMLDDLLRKYGPT
jgi:hypothetical protein